jgi:hypothetical protein
VVAAKTNRKDVLAGVQADPLPALLGESGRPEMGLTLKRHLFCRTGRKFSARFVSAKTDRHMASDTWS